MKKLGVLMLFLSIIVAAGCSKDDDYLDPNRNVADQFDPLFAQKLQKRGYIADAKNITPEEVKDITVLDIVYSGEPGESKLTSLRGIEYFELLTKLNCGYNQLTTLDVSKNTALADLWCYDNQLATLDVSKNTALTNLDCGFNQLPTLDVSKNTALTGLWCDGNQLTTLDVSKNTALQQLHCGFNQLPTLDVSKNAELIYLECHDNQLTTLDVSKNAELTRLNCKENPGDGTVFPVMAWFDNNSIPYWANFTTGSWEYNGATITIDYRKAK